MLLKSRSSPNFDDRIMKHNGLHIFKVLLTPFRRILAAHYLRVVEEAEILAVPLIPDYLARSVNHRENGG
jgi:hypothetical protein